MKNFKKGYFGGEYVGKFLFILLALVAIGEIIESMAGIDNGALNGALVIATVFLGVILSFGLAFYYDGSKQEKRLVSLQAGIKNAYLAELKANERVSVMEAEQITFVKETFDTIQQSKRLSNECKRLRASQQTLIDSKQTLSTDLADALENLADAQARLANASKLQASAIADAKAKALLPYKKRIEAGENYLLHTACKSILLHNSSYSDADKERAGELVEGLKDALNEFKKAGIESAVKTVLG